MGSQFMKNRVRLASKLAANMHQMHGRQMIVVLHQELGLGHLVDFGLIDGIADSFKALIDEFPMIDYVVENLTFINFDTGMLVSRNSHFAEPVRLAEYLREKLQTERIGTVLDTCHLLATIRLHNLVAEGTQIKPLEIEDYFHTYKDTLKLVHLANAFNYGIGVDHGTTFATPQEQETMVRILQGLKDIGFKNPITLEINEPDSNCAERFSYMRKLLLSMGVTNI